MDRKALRVVVASPGDVARERDAVARVFEEINRGVARDRGVLFEVWRWETDAWPQFHPEGPQGAIDRQLRIGDCDLLVGVFWKHFGTPTADAASGTEHEIRLAHAAWQETGRPHVMLYFSQRPASPQTEDELDQWKRVFAFRKEFQKAGLIWSYRSPASFEALLREHATKFLLDLRDRDAPLAKVTASDAAVRSTDAEADALLGALTAAARQGAGVLPPERVNALAESVGLRPGAVLGAVERLRDKGAICLHWGGGVSVHAPGSGGPGS